MCVVHVYCSCLLFMFIAHVHRSCLLKCNDHGNQLRICRRFASVQGEIVSTHSMVAFDGSVGEASDSLPRSMDETPVRKRRVSINAMTALVRWNASILGALLRCITVVQCFVQCFVRCLVRCAILYAMPFSPSCLVVVGMLTFFFSLFLTFLFFS